MFVLGEDQEARERTCRSTHILRLSKASCRYFTLIVGLVQGTRLVRERTGCSTHINSINKYAMRSCAELEQRLKRLAYITQGVYLNGFNSFKRNALLLL